jgi:hypothetical protein
MPTLLWIMFLAIYLAAPVVAALARLRQRQDRRLVIGITCPMQRGLRS